MNSLSCCHADDLFGNPFCWSSCLLFDGSKKAYICQMLSDCSQEYFHIGECYNEAFSIPMSIMFYMSEIIIIQLLWYIGKS